MNKKNTFQTILQTMTLGTLMVMPASCVWASNGQSQDATVMISATVPAVCQIDQQVEEASTEKITMSLDRFCNATHSVSLSASLDDAPVDGLKLKLEGKKIKGGDGEWSLYSRSPPAKEKSTLVIMIPKDLQDKSGISVSVTIQADS